jgi:hypothetical protein
MPQLELQQTIPDGQVVLPHCCSGGGAIFTHSTKAGQPGHFLPLGVVKKVGFVLHSSPVLQRPHGNRQAVRGQTSVT